MHVDDAEALALLVIGRREREAERLRRADERQHLQLAETECPRRLDSLQQEEAREDAGDGADDQGNDDRACGGVAGRTPGQPEEELPGNRQKVLAEREEEGERRAQVKDDVADFRADGRRFLFLFCALFCGAWRRGALRRSVRSRGRAGPARRRARRG